ncbi:MAG: M20/M25/M40 family metallo-hydrolase [Kofleriaceae bacterium]
MARDATPVVADAGADAVPSCVDDGEPFSEQALRAEVTFLASPELDGRAPGSPADLAVRTHLIARFACLGLVSGVADGSYLQPFSFDGNHTANVIGYLKGASATVGSEIIVVGAHHDHLGDGMLGANDNASGVAGVLAIAQAIRQGAAPQRTIAFVLFGGEESGLLGSQHYAANTPAALPIDKVVQFVNLDMIGSHASHKGVHLFGAFRGLPAHTILRALEDDHPSVTTKLGGHSVRGDQVPFCERDIPYVFFWTPDARCYHEKCDTVAKLDLPGMAGIAALAGGLVRGLADTKTDLGAVRKRSGCGR